MVNAFKRSCLSFGIASVLLIPGGPFGLPEGAKSPSPHGSPPPDDPIVRPEDPRPLLMITVEPGADLRAILQTTSIVDHYYERREGRLVHRLLAVPRGERPRVEPATGVDVRVVDADTRGSEYAWITGLDPASSRVREARGRVLASRSGTATWLVAFPKDPAVREAVGEMEHAARLRRIDLNAEVRPAWLAPAESPLARDLVARRPSNRVTGVSQILRRIEIDTIRTIVEQLTGGRPLVLDTETRTIQSRFAPGEDMAFLVRWVAQEFREAGLTAEIDRFHSRIHGKDLDQVVATIPGTDRADELVLVTAHLDAVRGSPGADDNASGCAAVIAAGRQLAAGGLRFRRTVRLVLFNDEEQGLIGSNDYARRLANEGRRVVGVLNLDMVAHDADRDMEIQLQSDGTPAANALCAALTDVVSTNEINLHIVTVVDPEESSDYAAFWRVGIPAINIGDEYFLCDNDCENPPERGVIPPRGDFLRCYHRPCDRMDDPTFRIEQVAEVAKMVVAGVAQLAEVADEAQVDDSEDEPPGD